VRLGALELAHESRRRLCHAVQLSLQIAALELLALGTKLRCNLVELVVEVPRARAAACQQPAQHVSLGAALFDGERRLARLVEQQQKLAQPLQVRPRNDPEGLLQLLGRGPRGRLIGLDLAAEGLGDLGNVRTRREHRCDLHSPLHSVLVQHTQQARAERGTEAGCLAHLTVARRLA